MADRRNQTERRSTPDRRQTERRVQTIQVDEERRGVADQRAHKRRESIDRRSGHDRRTVVDHRETPAPYSNDEVARIRAALADATNRLACPRCNGDLTFGPSVGRGRQRVRELRCESCRRGLMIGD